MNTTVSNLSDALTMYQSTVSPSEMTTLRSILKNNVLPELLITYNLDEPGDESLFYTLSRVPINGFVGIAKNCLSSLDRITNSDTRKVKKSKFNRFCK